MIESIIAYAKVIFTFIPFNILSRMNIFLLNISDSLYKIIIHIRRTISLNYDSQ